MWIPSIFSDGAVLQRGTDNIIIGRDEGAKLVKARLEGEEYSAPVINGRFELCLPSHSAATGLTLEIRGSKTVILRDICFGDVFLLSGQSNMALRLAETPYADDSELKKVRLPDIRHFAVTPDYSFTEAGELQPSEWIKAEGESVMNISATGFFFAEKLYESVGVPIGLVLNAVGGANVEAWMSASALTAFGDYDRYYSDFLEKGALLRFMHECEKGTAEWYKSVNSGESKKLCRAVPEKARSFVVPKMTTGTELRGFSGSVWFYKNFDLEETAGEALLQLGELVDSDEVYVNGVKVGETSYRYPTRKYGFDGRLLNKGTNLIAVRLIIERGAGGFIPEHEYYIAVGESKQPLSGEWRYFVEKQAERSIEEFVSECNTTVGSDSVWLASDRKEGFLAAHLPTALYNGSLLPLKGVSFKAVLWYQGESNAADPDAERYAEKLRAMITEWRLALCQRLPLICVEMANYTEPASDNPDSTGWSIIQAQQRSAEQVIANCAVVSARDLGAPYELHPPNKAELGRRLAIKATEFLY